jgi:hypothetical protein
MPEFHDRFRRGKMTLILNSANCSGLIFHNQIVHAKIVENNWPEKESAGSTF